MGSAVAALVVVGDMTPRTIAFFILKGEGDDDGSGSSSSTEKVLEFIYHRTAWITLVVLLVSPLCFMKSITRLRFTGIITSFTVAYLITTIIVMYINPHLDACGDYGPAPCNENVVAFNTTHLMSSLLQAIPILFFAFSLAYNVSSSR